MWPPSVEQIITILSLVAAIMAWLAKAIWAKKFKEAKKAQLAEKDEQIKTLKESKDNLLAQKDEQIKLLEMTNSVEAVKIIESNKKLFEGELNSVRKGLLSAQDRADRFKKELQSAQDRAEILEQKVTTKNTDLQLIDNLLEKLYLTVTKEEAKTNKQLENIDEIYLSTSNIKLSDSIQYKVTEVDVPKYNRKGKRVKDIKVINKKD